MKRNIKILHVQIVKRKLYKQIMKQNIKILIL